MRFFIFHPRKRKIVKPTILKEQIHFGIDGFKKLDTKNYENRKRVIDIFVNAVYVYDGELKLTFNYKDGVKHLNLREFEGSSTENSGAVIALNPNLTDNSIIGDGF